MASFCDVQPVLRYCVVISDGQDRILSCEWFSDAEFSQALDACTKASAERALPLDTSHYRPPMRSELNPDFAGHVAELRCGLRSAVAHSRLTGDAGLFPEQNQVFIGLVRYREGCCDTVSASQ